MTTTKLPSFLFALCIFSGMIGLSSCDRLPGKPKQSDRWKPPEAEKNFQVLFKENCRACHAGETNIGASISMRDPLYLAIIPRDVLRKITAEGIPGTTMPGFLKANGGALTDEQVDIVVNGILDWGKSAQIAKANLPPYSAPLGDANRGTEVYNRFCASCHGQVGQNGKAGSILQPDYLQLVSDQYLRSVTIAGRPELGMPNYQNLVPNQSMSDQDIADIVGWLASHRNAANVVQGANGNPNP
ncbi:MAG: cytochrome c [Chthoniobacterales bacterium]|jgi:cytochrome c oxidase cbb3-type subunit 3